MTADWRRALDIYVTGRNRALTVEEKSNAVGAISQGVPGISRSGSMKTDSSTGGITVPRTLEYYRNAGTWRDRIEGTRQRKAGPGA